MHEGDCMTTWVNTLWFNMHFIPRCSLHFTLMELQMCCPLWRNNCLCHFLKKSLHKAFTYRNADTTAISGRPVMDSVEKGVYQTLHLFQLKTWRPICLAIVHFHLTSDILLNVSSLFHLRYPCVICSFIYYYPFFGIVISLYNVTSPFDNLLNQKLRCSRLDGHKQVFLDKILNIAASRTHVPIQLLFKQCYKCN